MNKQNIDAVREHYDADPGLEWERLERMPFEFELTTYMMDKYVKAGDSVLDIGGGPGRYSIYYARKGCAVTLAELSQGNVDFAKTKAAEAGVNFPAYAVNCLELDELGLGQFDHVFLMGPLYHLQSEEDRVEAVNVALRRLKPGGNLYVSFISLLSGLIYDLQHGGYICRDVEDPACRELIDQVERGGDYIGPGFSQVCFFHPRNILPFMERFPLKKLHLFGQEGFLAPNKYQLMERDEAEIRTWVELAKRYIELPELLSWSEHLMYIGEKTPKTGVVLEGERLCLHVPTMEELWYREKLMADPATMDYNRGYDLPFEGYDRETGCIVFPKEKWPAWYDWFVGQGSKQFYAYIVRKSDGTFLGEVNVHKNEEKPWYEMGIVLEGKCRGQGYANEALGLLLQYAFEVLKVPAVHNNFEETRTAALRTHLAAGFAEYRRGGGVVELLITREQWEKRRETALTGGTTMFFDTEFLQDGEIMLKLDYTAPAQPEKNWLPAYYFHICLLDGTQVGSCDLRIGHNRKTYIGGNIGYRVDEPYRGHHYAARACRLLFTLAEKHGMDHVIITCVPENVPSARICERCGGVLLETAAIPEDNEMYAEGKRWVRVYRFDLGKGESA